MMYCLWLVSCGPAESLFKGALLVCLFKTIRASSVGSKTIAGKVVDYRRQVMDYTHIEKRSPKLCTLKTE